MSGQHVKRRKPPVRRVRTEKLDLRIDPAFKRLVYAAAQARGVTVTSWVEEALNEALRRQGRKG